MLRACLAIVLLSCAASPVLAQNGRAEPSGAASAAGSVHGADAGASPTSPDKTSASTNYVRGSSTPASGQGSGGDDDSMLRVRVPKWNSFLPGMFR